MRVALVNNYLFPKGGAERVLLDEGSWLERRGEQVSYFGLQDPANPPGLGGEWLPAGGELRARGFRAGITGLMRFIDNREAGRAFGRFLAGVKPELVHVHNLYGGLTTAVLGPAREAGVPVVMTLHDYKLVSPSPNLVSRGRPCVDCQVRPGTPLCLLRDCLGSPGKTLAHWLESEYNRRRRAYGSVSAFIAPSRFMAEKAAAAGWDPARIHWVPNAMEPQATDATPVEGGYFFFAGRMAEEKGVGFLLEAWPGVRGELRLAGDGGSLDRYRQLAPPGVEFLGRVAPEGLGDLYRGALAVVVPSLWYENASMTVLEAMAHGRPVVATRMGGLPEQVEDGVTGILVEPGDRAGLRRALTRLAEEPGLAARLGRAGRARLEERFGHPRHGEALLAVYASVLGRGTR
ncbi:MAG TPA: glycosyltransferase [bacterium]|nr:glycosyltransferase [bacterium]